MSPWKERHAMGSITSRTTRDSLPSPIAGVMIEEVPFDAPWSWLAAGWRDMWGAPRVSLAYGILFALLSVGLTLGLLVTRPPLAGAGARRRVPAGGPHCRRRSLRSKPPSRTGPDRRFRRGRSCRPPRTGTIGVLWRHPGVPLLCVGAGRLAVVHAVPGKRGVAAAQRVRTHPVVHAQRSRATGGGNG